MKRNCHRHIRTMGCKKDIDLDRHRLGLIESLQNKLDCTTVYKSKNIFR